MLQVNLTLTSPLTRRAVLRGVPGPHAADDADEARYAGADDVAADATGRAAGVHASATGLRVAKALAAEAAEMVPPFHSLSVFCLGHGYALTLCVLLSRNMCPFVLGMILLFCGMLVVALCFYMSQLPEKAIKRTCELMLPKRSRVYVPCDYVCGGSFVPALTVATLKSQSWVQYDHICGAARDNAAPPDKCIFAAAMQA